MFTLITQSPLIPIFVSQTNIVNLRSHIVSTANPFQTLSMYLIPISFLTGICI